MKPRTIIGNTTAALTALLIPAGQTALTVFDEQSIALQRANLPDDATNPTMLLDTRATISMGLAGSLYTLLRLMLDLFHYNKWYQLTDAQRAVVAVASLIALGAECYSLARVDKPEHNLSAGLAAAGSMLLFQLARGFASYAVERNDGTVVRDDIVNERRPISRA